MIEQAIPPSPPVRYEGSSDRFRTDLWGMRYQIAGQRLLPMLPASPILSKPHLAEPDYMVGAQGSLFDMTHTG